MLAARQPAPAAPVSAGTWKARLASVARGRLRRNTLAGSAAAGGNLLVSALSYRIYLQYLGYERYGLWLSIAVVLSLAQFGNLGLAPAVTRAVARELGRDNPAGIQANVSTAVLALGAAGILIAIAVLCLARPMVALLRLDPAASSTALSLLPAVALLSVYVLQVEAANAALVGIGRLDLSVFTQFASRVLTLGVSATLLASGFGIASLPIAAFTGYAALHAATILLLRRRIGLSPIRLSAFSRDCLRHLASFGSGVFAVSLFSFLIAPLNRVVLARFAGAAAVPVYDLAYSLAISLRSFLDNGLRSIMPEAARLEVARPSGRSTNLQAGVIEQTPPSEFGERSEPHAREAGSTRTPCALREQSEPDVREANSTRTSCAPPEQGEPSTREALLARASCALRAPSALYASEASSPRATRAIREQSEPNQASSPRATRAIREQSSQTEALSRLQRRALLFAATAGIVLFGSVILAAGPLLRLWLGARFTPALVPAARILLAGAYVSLLGVPAYYTLLGSAQLKRITLSHAIMAATNIALIAAAAATSLTPIHAAAATAAGMLASTLYLLKPAKPTTFLLLASCSLLPASRLSPFSDLLTPVLLSPGSSPCVLNLRPISRRPGIPTLASLGLQKALSASSASLR